MFTSRRDFRGRLLVGSDDKSIASDCNIGQSENLHRRRRARFFDLVALVVDDGANASPCRTSDHWVTDAKCSVLHEHSGDRTATNIEVRLKHDTACTSVWSRSKIFEVGHDEHVLEKIIDAEVLQCRHFDHDGFAAPCFGDKSVLRQLLHHTSRIGVVTIDLVDGNNDRNIGSFCVIDGFDGLRHHTIVGSNHKNDDVGRIGTTGTHGGKRLMARGIEERDCSIVLGDLVSTDVLGNTASFARNNVCIADLIEKFGLAVIDVTHNSDHRRTVRPCFIGRIVNIDLEQEHLLQFDFLLFTRIHKSN